MTFNIQFDQRFFSSREKATIVVILAPKRLKLIGFFADFVVYEICDGRIAFDFVGIIFGQSAGSNKLKK